MKKTRSYATKVLHILTLCVVLGTDMCSFLHFDKTMLWFVLSYVNDSVWVMIGEKRTIHILYFALCFYCLPPLYLYYSLSSINMIFNHWLWWQLIMEWWLWEYYSHCLLYHKRYRYFPQNLTNNLRVTWWWYFVWYVHRNWCDLLISFNQSDSLVNANTYKALNRINYQ